MDRTLGADWVDIGGGRRGFRDQNRAAGAVGSEVQALWTNSVQEEILAVIVSADIVPNKDVWTQLLEAIDKKIEAVRVSQPIYPDVLTADGKFTVTQTAPGVVSVAAGTTWTMRGGKARTSVLTPLNTAPSKLYHLRYRDGAFALYDIASLVYNPTSLPEANTAFDSTYDDMLVAKVFTDGSNIATITTLSNKAFLQLEVPVSMNAPNSLNWSTLAGSGVTLNWARKPRTAQPAWQGFRSFNDVPNGSTHPLAAGIIRALEIRVPANSINRYVAGDLEYWYEDDAVNQGWISFIWNFLAS